MKIDIKSLISKNFVNIENLDIKKNLILKEVTFTENYKTNEIEIFNK